MNRIKVEDYLIADGVQTNISGFGYLVDAIMLYRPGMKMTQELYPTISEMHHTTPSRVERAVRHAIESRIGGTKVKNSSYISFVRLMCERGEVRDTAKSDS